jgi:hypothetical protein
MVEMMGGLCSLFSSSSKYPMTACVFCRMHVLSFLFHYGRCLDWYEDLYSMLRLVFIPQFMPRSVDAVRYTLWYQRLSQV